MMNDILAGLRQVSLAIERLPLVGTLGWQDIRQRYRRSAIGPFWLTISMGILVATIGLVFGQVFKSSTDDYIPYLAIGIIFWTFITTSISEACVGFIDAEPIIKQLPIPLFVHILRVLWRNLLILGHNIIIIPPVFLAIGKTLTPLALLAIPGLLLVLLCFAWVGLLFGLTCARYRDLPQIIASVLQVAFYLTPIIWMPSFLPERTGMLFLELNPFYHFLNLIRSPLLGEWPSIHSWLVVAVIAVTGWCVTLILFARLHKRVAYWI